MNHQIAFPKAATGLNDCYCRGQQGVVKARRVRNPLYNTNKRARPGTAALRCARIIPFQSSSESGLSSCRSTVLLYFASNLEDLPAGRSASTRGPRHCSSESCPSVAWCASCPKVSWMAFASRSLQWRPCRRLPSHIWYVSQFLSAPSRAHSSVDAVISDKIENPANAMAKDGHIDVSRQVSFKLSNRSTFLHSSSAQTQNLAASSLRSGLSLAVVQAAV